jgi:hypothetical protein
MRTSSKRPPANSSDSAGFSFAIGTPYADKTEYTEKNLLFKVASIEFEEGRGFDGADRWSVTVQPEDGRGSELLTFSCNDKRDQQMHAALQYINRNGPIHGVRPKRFGKAYYLDNGATVNPT